jgi:DNA repair protein RadC
MELAHSGLTTGTSGLILIAGDSGCATMAKNKSADDLCIEKAMKILAQRISSATCFDNPGDVSKYLMMQASKKTHECFSVFFLDAQNKLITLEEMFRGTLTQTSVYPKEIVTRALELKAASVLFSHNHPSGSVQPSRADEALTHTLKASLKLVDVVVLDHIIVTSSASFSMAAHGLL